MEGSAHQIQFQGFCGGNPNVRPLQQPRSTAVSLIATTKTETQHFVERFGNWRPYVPHLGIQLDLLYWLTCKLTSFQWVLTDRLRFFFFRLYAFCLREVSSNNLFHNYQNLKPLIFILTYLYFPNNLKLNTILSD